MTSQDLANELLRSWQELWRLSPSERLRRIDEIAESFLDDQLALVSIEMEKAA